MPGAICFPRVWIDNFSIVRVAWVKLYMAQIDARGRPRLGCDNLRCTLEEDKGVLVESLKF